MSLSAQTVVFPAPSGTNGSTVFDDQMAAVLNGTASPVGKLKSLSVVDVVTTVAIVGLIGLLVWFIIDLIMRASRLQKLKKYARGRRGSKGPKSAPAGDTQNPITETSTGEDSDTVQDGMGELLKQENVPVVIDTGFSDEDSFGWAPGNAFAYGATEYGYQYDPDDFSQNV